MSHTGRVVAVDRASVPDTAAPAWRVTVERDGDAVWRCFFLSLDGPRPTVDQRISWGPHHAWWGDERASKSFESDPNAPLR
ncbi:hypothetical protein ACU5AX_01445 [Sphingomonas sp. XXL09]|uniref:hypothetical protein n=1 Tax=Sphingomonas sp. XXL09 TaxID=3457787 RepID=UPI00406BD708